MNTRALNFRDLGEVDHIHIPRGMFLRSGKLSVLSREECRLLCQQYGIGCVIDLRTPIEAAEYPDPLPHDITYLQIPLLEDTAVGITHETGSDPMTIIRSLSKEPEKLKEMIPDFMSLYKQIVTDEYSRRQLEKVTDTLQSNAAKGICTLFHCTAGKDRTGIVSMALLKTYGVSDEHIIRDYMHTNRNVFWPTVKKCAAIALLTGNWKLVKMAYKSFLADKELIKTALHFYQQ